MKLWHCVGARSLRALWTLEELGLDYDLDREDEEEKERKLIAEKLKSNLNVHILGTYEARSKKHIAKDEATRL